jgi:YhcH/YjgK/YiaL family protein
MIKSLGRREFLFGAFFIGTAGTLWKPPLWNAKRAAPRVRKLADWRSVKGPGELERAFEYLRTAGVEDKAPGRYAIDGDRIYATVVVDKTRSADTAQFEAHRKYLDIHYLVSGVEMIGSADATSLHEVKQYAPETEAALFERPAKYTRLMLKPGEFVLFFPGQAHMPGCYLDKSEEIKKVVVKVMV